MWRADQLDVRGQAGWLNDAVTRCTSRHEHMLVLIMGLGVFLKVRLAALQRVAESASRLGQTLATCIARPERACLVLLAHGTIPHESLSRLLHSLSDAERVDAVRHGTLAEAMDREETGSRSLSGLVAVVDPHLSAWVDHAPWGELLRLTLLPAVLTYRDCGRGFQLVWPCVPASGSADEPTFIRPLPGAGCWQLVMNGYRALVERHMQYRLLNMLVVRTFLAPCLMSLIEEGACIPVARTGHAGVLLCRIVIKASSRT